MANESDDEEFLEELHQRTFYVRRCIRYHMHREAFFGKLNKLNSFLGVIFGSAAIAALLKGNDTLTLVSAGVVTFFSAMDLVVGTSSKMSLHSDLRKRFLLIEVGLLTPGLTVENLQQAKIDCRKIEADEPPGLPVLNEMAANEVIYATYPSAQAKHLVAVLPWYKKLTANVINWDVGRHLNV